MTSDRTTGPIHRFFHRGWGIIHASLLNLYYWLKIPQGIDWVRFLCHCYSTSQFSPLNAKGNVVQLIQWKQGEWLDCTAQGKLRRLTTKWAKTWFILKNILLGGSFQSRVKRVVYYTFLTLTIEIYNPFDKKVLEFFLEKKLHFIQRLLKKFKTVNGQSWKTEEVGYHLNVFQRSSLLQGKIICEMHRAVKNQKEPAVVRDAREALKKGLAPLLITSGCSGAYWMRGTSREIVGLFKPFDEEIHAPNNPIGPIMQGAMGHRKTRMGVRVGEATHREVAAYLVDQFFEFGMVPRTYYATFTHQAFFNAQEDRFGKRAFKKKYGSFQEFLEGFSPLYQLTEEEQKKIPLEEFQLLVILDVILGNTDRNMGNILIGDEKIAAIDHGLVFPDFPEDVSSWYWDFFEQGKQPIFSSFLDLLSAFPYEKLGWKLKKKCQIQEPSLARMRERIALFREGVLAGYAPADLIDLMKYKYLLELVDLDATLADKAKELVLEYKKTKASSSESTSS